ncbi:ABC transporter ATP-binding protein [Neobacillus cucumis]|uniref:ABC transporter ATP-binding protein n=1 Tax=Neobacillus cucumis TaxID=1740721 RepID=UPI001964DF05|nr:ABC transporter ATP-binding protein [Neobacillus cucumis]MBM7652175.1 putative spermidine/putrescine transport system ATP-binding protein [Neobacillus cucumis]
MEKQYDVELKHIKKSFNGNTIVKDFSLQIERGEFISFLGPSGCGKTTTLNMIAGFLEADEGELLIKGRLMNGVPTYKRDLGMVFQTYSLFPHMTVYENIAYGLKLRKLPKVEIDVRVKKVLELVKLPQVQTRFPKQLSGGQRQRIAIARALVMEPSILLLDEPLSNLDAKLREELRDELKRLHKEIGVTTIFVTHDQEEALSLSDRIVVLSHGNIEQIGSPSDIYHRPATEFVHTFIGKTNRLTGTVKALDGSDLTIHTEDGLSIKARNKEKKFVSGEKVSMYMRPETIQLTKDPAGSADVTTFSGIIKLVTFLGPITEYHISVGKHELIVRTQQPQRHFVEGAEVYGFCHTEDIMVVEENY